MERIKKRIKCTIKIAYVTRKKISKNPKKENKIFNNTSDKR